MRLLPIANPLGAGLSRRILASHRTRPEIVALAALGNLGRHAAGEPSISLADRTRGYRRAQPQ